MQKPGAFNKGFDLHHPTLAPPSWSATSKLYAAPARRAGGLAGESESAARGDGDTAAEELTASAAAACAARRCPRTTPSYAAASWGVMGTRCGFPTC